MLFFNPPHLVSFHVCLPSLQKLTSICPTWAQCSVPLPGLTLLSWSPDHLSCPLAHAHAADRLMLCWSFSPTPPFLEPPRRFLSGRGTLSPLLQPVTWIPQPLFPPPAPSHPQGHGSHRLCPPSSAEVTHASFSPELGSDSWSPAHTTEVETRLRGRTYFQEAFANCLDFLPFPQSSPIPFTYSHQHFCWFHVCLSSG